MCDPSVRRVRVSLQLSACVYIINVIVKMMCVQVSSVGHWWEARRRGLTAVWEEGVGATLLFGVLR